LPYPQWPLQKQEKKESKTKAKGKHPYNLPSIRKGNGKKKKKDPGPVHFLQRRRRGKKKKIAIKKKKRRFKGSKKKKEEEGKKGGQAMRFAGDLKGVKEKRNEKAKAHHWLSATNEEKLIRHLTSTQGEKEKKKIQKRLDFRKKKKK